MPSIHEEEKPTASAVHFTAATVAEHNRPDDGWIIVRGEVYNVTSFLTSHPGGPGVILPFLGRDATEPFEETGHSQHATMTLAKLRIGILDGGAADQSAAAVRPPPPVTPSLIKPGGGTGGWQAMDCPVCGPICGAMHQPGDPAVMLANAQKQGDAAVRMGRWSEALDHYHEGVRAVRKSTAAQAVAAIRVGASLAQRKLGSLRSALRHADLALASCRGSSDDGQADGAAAAAANAARGAALEALGLVTDAHAAFVEAARLAPLQTAHAEAADRLLPLVHFLLALHDDNDAAGAAAVEEKTPAGSGLLLSQLPPLAPHQEALVEKLQRVAATKQLAAHLLPLPTPARVLSDDRFEKSGWRTRQQRLLALLGVDVASNAARAAHGGHNATEGVREWLHRKASELGLDVVGELVSEALAVEDKEKKDDDEEDEDGEESSSSEEEVKDDDDDEEEGPMGSEEVSLDASTYGRCLVQLELSPRSQRLTLSLISLNSTDLGEPTLKYVFAVGLASAYLLEATSLQAPLFEMSEWRTAERGALEPVEGLPPVASVERRVRAFVDFFRSGEGSQPPVAPQEMPVAGAFDAVVTPGELVPLA